MLEDDTYSKAYETEKMSACITDCIVEDSTNTLLKTNVLEMLLSRYKEDRDRATELLVRNVLNVFTIYTIRSDIKEEIWIFNEGIYTPQGKTFIKEHLRNVMGEAYTPHLANQVIEKIMTDTYIDSDAFFNNNYPEEIVCENGLLNLKTKKLLPYDPKKIHFCKIPVTYNPYAICKEIDNFLDEVLETLEDKQKMYEFVGYCLWKTYKFEKAAIWIGFGGNGKDTMLETLKKFLGQNNTKAFTYSALTKNDFAESELFGKLANISGELSKETLHESSKFKALTGRSLISGNRKFKETINFVSYCKMIFATNELAKTEDTSDGFFRRWLVFRFPYRFYSPEEKASILEQGYSESKLKLKDPNKAEKICSPKEMSGLLNKAIEAINRVWEKGDFTSSNTSREVEIFWTQASDSFSAFCNEFIKSDCNSYVIKEDLRKAYTEYCRKSRLKLESDERYMRTVLMKKFGVGDERKRLPVIDDKGEELKDEFSGRPVTEQKSVWTGISMTFKTI